MTVRERIEALLRDAGVSWEVLDHPHGATAVELAHARGTPLEIGGKSIVMKVEGRGFVMLAVRACDTIDNHAFRKQLGARRYRFATRDELWQITGLEPGTVPPFGRPIFDLPLFADRALAEGDHIAFTPGLATVTLSTTAPGWRLAARPEAVFAFARADAATGSTRT